jgi:hypothetical protein
MDGQGGNEAPATFQRLQQTLAQRAVISVSCRGAEQQMTTTAVTVHDESFNYDQHEDHVDDGNVGNSLVTGVVILESTSSLARILSNFTSKAAYNYLLAQAQQICSLVCISNQFFFAFCDNILPSLYF